MRIIRAGSTGEEVRDIQRRLLGLGARIEASELGGTYGASTEAAVRAFQTQRSLPADGIVGPDTWGALVEAWYRLGDRTLYLRAPMYRGDDVRELQRRLNELGFDAGKEDGIFGRRTEEAVRAFQRNVAAQPDGIAGPDTVRMLERLRPTVPGTSRAVVREEEAVRSMQGSLAGSVIAIDAGHGPDDPGVRGPGGTDEHAVTLALGGSLRDELARRGATPHLVRGEGETPDASTRAERANATGAAALVSFHLGATDPTVDGPVVFHWGSTTTHSPAGMRLAHLIAERLASGAGIDGVRVAPLAVALLRETRMPAVIVEPGSLVDAASVRRVAEASFAQGVTRAVADALEAFLSAVEPATGG